MSDMRMEQEPTADEPTPLDPSEAARPPGSSDSNDNGNGNIDTDDILIVRRGPGANCSSIGSALDVLFLSAVAAGAVLAGIAAAFGGHQSGGSRSAAHAPPPESDAKGDNEESARKVPLTDVKERENGHASST